MLHLVAFEMSGKVARHRDMFVTLSYDKHE
jgi:hypothetical protein